MNLIMQWVSFTDYPHVHMSTILEDGEISVVVGRQNILARDHI